MYRRKLTVYEVDQEPQQPTREALPMKQDIVERGTQNLGGGQLSLPRPWTWPSAIVVGSVGDIDILPPPLMIHSRSNVPHTSISMVCSTAVKHTTSHNKRHTATLHSNLPHFLERKTPNFNLKTRKTTTLPQAIHPVDNRNTNPIELGNSISEKRRDHSTPC